MNEPATPDIPVLTEPADGIPAVVDTPVALQHAIAALRAGSGPVAIDTERAQGFRYSARAYLIQLRRIGSGTHLVDPIAFQHGRAVADLSELNAAISDGEWILHAATQDLPCLVEIGLVPQTLFDTELAGRLLGLPKVALGTMVEHYFGVHLMKEHSAADWSQRPIPTDWLSYAALDVELLVELRERMLAELKAAGKDEWAQQECAWLVQHPDHGFQPRVDPWRRTSGMNEVCTRQGMALVRAFWYARDDLAAELDLAPSRLLRDRGITQLAALVTKEHPELPTMRDLNGIPEFRRRVARQHGNTWSRVLREVADLPTAEWPAMRARKPGVPDVRAWPRLRPVAAVRYERIRPALQQLAADHQLPTENLISPAAVRELVWEPPSLDRDAIDAALQSLEVRAWQRELVVDTITELLAAEK